MGRKQEGAVAPAASPTRFSKEATFAEVLAATTELGSELSIAWVDAITLKGVADITNLNANDFLFI